MSARLARAGNAMADRVEAVLDGRLRAGRQPVIGSIQHAAGDQPHHQAPAAPATVPITGTGTIDPIMAPAPAAASALPTPLMTALPAGLPV